MQQGNTVGSGSSHHTFNFAPGSPSASPAHHQQYHPSSAQHASSPDAHAIYGYEHSSSSANPAAASPYAAAAAAHYAAAQQAHAAQHHHAQAHQHQHQQHAHAAHHAAQNQRHNHHSQHSHHSPIMPAAMAVPFSAGAIPGSAGLLDAVGGQNSVNNGNLTNMSADRFSMGSGVYGASSEYGADSKPNHNIMLESAVHGGIAPPNSTMTGARTPGASSSVNNPTGYGLQ